MICQEMDFTYTDHTTTSWSMPHKAVTAVMTPTAA